ATDVPAKPSHAAPTRGTVRIQHVVEDIGCQRHATHAAGHVRLKAAGADRYGGDGVEHVRAHARVIDEAVGVRDVEVVGYAEARCEVRQELHAGQAGPPVADLPPEL